MLTDIIFNNLKFKASFSSILILAIAPIVIGVVIKYGLNVANVDSETEGEISTAVNTEKISDGEEGGVLPVMPDSVFLKTPGGTVKAIVANTPETRERGLGDRDYLPADHGMIFVFDEPGKNGFWMAGMRFPLDMVWIDENKRVIGVTADIEPETYPEAFFPPAPVLYVLELNAGSARRLDIATGTEIVF